MSKTHARCALCGLCAVLRQDKRISADCEAAGGIES